MTTQTNGDELERKKFEKWFEKSFREKIKDRPAMDQRGLHQVAWLGWQAALISRREEA